MYLDLSCPVELLGYELTHDERGIHGFVRLNNLSKRHVNDFESIITWRCASGDSIEIPLGAAGMTARPHSTFVLSIETGPVPAGTWNSLLFVRVGFDEGPDWRGEPARLVDVALAPVPTRQELSALGKIAGADAAVRPVLARQYWLCACGRPNGTKARACARCGRSRREVKRLARQLSGAFDKAAGAQPDSGGAPQAGPRRPADSHILDKGPQAATPDAQALSYGAPLSHRALRARYLRQRSLLIRRTITMLAAALFIALTAFSWRWLDGMRQRAREIVPPMRIEENTAP